MIKEKEKLNHQLVSREKRHRLIHRRMKELVRLESLKALKIKREKARIHNNAKGLTSNKVTENGTVSGSRVIKPPVEKCETNKLW